MSKRVGPAVPCVHPERAVAGQADQPGHIAGLMFSTRTSGCPHIKPHHRLHASRPTVLKPPGQGNVYVTAYCHSCGTALPRGCREVAELNRRHRG